MSFKFSPESLKQLNTCHPDLVRVFQAVIEKTPFDFFIDQGARSIEEARKNFKNGKSKLDPDKGEFSKHIVGKGTGRDLSFALDIFPILNNKREWSDNACGQIAECVREVSEDMGIKIRWGGAWKGWDFPNTPDMLKDLGHFELA